MWCRGNLQLWTGYFKWDVRTISVHVRSQTRWIKTWSFPKPNPQWFMCLNLTRREHSTAMALKIKHEQERDLRKGKSICRLQKWTLSTFILAIVLKWKEPKCEMLVIPIKWKSTHSFLDILHEDKYSANRLSASFPQGIHEVVLIQFEARAIVSLNHSFCLASCMPNSPSWLWSAAGGDPPGMM